MNILNIWSLCSEFVDAVDHLELGGGHGDLNDAARDHPFVVAVHEPHKLTPEKAILKFLTKYIDCSYLSESPMSMTI